MKNNIINNTEILKKGNNATQTQKQEETTKERTNREEQFSRLLEASNKAKEIKEQLINNAKSENQALFFEIQTINYYLLNYIYKTDGITEFKKFKEWKQNKATVKKGAKAYPIWGQPVGRQKEEEAKSKGENYEANEEENRRFPMCYVFSNLQVVFKEQRTEPEKIEAQKVEILEPIEVF